MQKRPRPVFHMHLSKTAGTSVNLWLQSFAHVLKCRNYRDFGTDMSEGIIIHQFYQNPPLHLPIYDENAMNFRLPIYSARDQQIRYAAEIEYSWKNFDILHGHVPIMMNRPEDAFVFTVLRDPIGRAISKYVDHMSLNKSDFALIQPEIQDEMIFLLENGLDAAIACYQFGGAMSSFFVDHQCRVLLIGRYTVKDVFDMSPAERADRAIEQIDQYIDFVGIYERIDTTLNILAEKIGVCPPDLFPKINSRPNHAHLRQISPQARQWLQDNNQGDQKLYGHFLDRFDRQSHGRSRYEITDFEDSHVLDRMSELSPVAVGAERLFDMNMAIVGRGYHYREAIGTLDCIRWTGPGNQLLLYMPVPVGEQLKLRIYTKGWMDWSQPERLQLRLDNELIQHDLEHPPRMANAITAVYKSSRPYVKITIDLAADTSETAAPQGDDTLRRGFALWGYSYEVI